MTLLFSGAGEPDWEVSHKGHGRLERRQVWVSGEPEGYGDLPGLDEAVSDRATLAARELGKLNDEDLERLLRLIRSLKTFADAK